MNKLNFTSKNNGDVLNASEWNAVVSKTDELVQAVNDGAVSGGGSGETVVTSDPHMSFDATGKHNLTISTTAADQYQKNGQTKGGKINIEPISDLQIKPGDDVILCSHHREDPTEVSVKIHDGEDHPVKLQVNTADIVLTTKDKDLTMQKDETGADTSTALYTDPAVLNVTVNSAKNTRGYLKVRAQAIDLRSETHGGIALQPKGKDSQNHMNKIKFEHGGGDGLEFGTFNTEKTSIFTDEYRFNKDGVWKMATREKVASDKADANDATTAYKYVKQEDDFYDIIDPVAYEATTSDIIKTANAFNGSLGVHSKVTTKGNLEIETEMFFEWLTGESLPTPDITIDGTGHSLNMGIIANSAKRIFTGQYTEAVAPAVGEPIFYTAFKSDDLFQDPIGMYGLKTTAMSQLATAKDGDVVVFQNVTNSMMIPVGAPSPTSDFYFKIHKPGVNIESSGNIKIQAGNKLELKGILDFGSSFQFGETDEGIEVQYKLTKKNATKDCGVIKVVGVNNHATNDLTVEGVTIAPGETGTIAQCSILDMVKLVNYMKTNNQGPWANL